MAIIATMAQERTYEPIEPGTYPARCIQIVHIGTVPDYIDPNKPKKNKVRLGWELPTELKVFKPELGEQPRMISKDFTLSMHEKSTLRKFVASWLGSMTEEQAAMFDVTKLLGLECVLTISNDTKPNGKTYDGVTGIGKPMKGMVIPPAINPLRILDYENFDWDVFNALPEFVRKQIESSEQYLAMTSQQAPAPAEYDQTNSLDTKLEGIPF